MGVLRGWWHRFVGWRRGLDASDGSKGRHRGGEVHLMNTPTSGKAAGAAAGPKSMPATGGTDFRKGSASCAFGGGWCFSLAVQCWSRWVSRCLGGLGQALGVFLGIAVMAFALMRALGDYDARHEPPVPPGDPGGIW